MQCPYCQYENEAGSRFCVECGNVLPEESELTGEQRYQVNQEGSAETPVDVASRETNVEKNESPVISTPQAVEMKSQIVSPLAEETETWYDASEEQRKQIRKWKIIAGVVGALCLVFFFGFLYAVDLYNDRVGEINSLIGDNYDLKQSYRDLEKDYNELIELYDLEGRYAVKLTAVYNGDTEYNKISDELNSASLDSICVAYVIHDPRGKWEDKVYADVISVDGTVLTPKEENANHTWGYPKLSSTTGEEKYKGWFRTDWTAGTYKIMFYQENQVIASFDIEVE